MAANDKESKCSRRQFVLQTPAAAALMGAVQLQLPSPLMPTSEEVTKELSELASNIPGLGQADVFYPTFFKGEWKVSEVLHRNDSGRTQN